MAIGVSLLLLGSCLSAMQGIPKLAISADSLAVWCCSAIGVLRGTGMELD